MTYEFNIKHNISLIIVINHVKVRSEGIGWHFINDIHEAKHEPFMIEIQLARKEWDKNQDLEHPTMLHHQFCQSLFS